MTKLMAPVHPGEILKEEFMRPLGLSANGLARAVRVPPNRISAIVNGERSLTADTALRLAKAFGTTPEFWLNLQKQYELECARDEATDIARIEPIRARA
jgi:antitoxin HigA-1